MTVLDVSSVLTGHPATTPSREVLVEVATDRAAVRAYREMRRATFVAEQGLFARSDHDEVDDDPDTLVLVARIADGTIVGGVRVHPHPHAGGPDAGWWQGSRLVVRAGDRAGSGRFAGSALVRAACARAEDRGALRFDATVQASRVGYFRRMGWEPRGPVTVHGAPHEHMTWPIDRIASLVQATKAPLGPLLAPIAAGAGAYLGDDAVAVPSTSVLAACDAITPAMVERDPGWAGWCAVLVNVNDLAAMGATPVALLDALGAHDEAHAAQVVAGMAAAAEAYGVPVVGGHTQLGVPGALSITALGTMPAHAPRLVRGSGGRPGDRLRVVADLAGRWRPGYAGRQWDSTTDRTPDELRRLIGTLQRHRPAAAKDVSMAGLVGTTAMLAEASGCGAELEVAAIPKPGGASMGDWLTCFPGFALVTAERGDDPDAHDLDAALAPAVHAICGQLDGDAGVRLRWPDGVITTAVPGAATGLGPVPVPATSPPLEPRPATGGLHG